MRAVVQRVNNASVAVDGEKIAEIGKGLLLFAALHKDDTEKDMDYIIKKTLNLRVFENSEGDFDLSLKECNYDILVVSQFTLYADPRKGRRPSFIRSMPVHEASIEFYRFLKKFKTSYPAVKHGRFQATMDVELSNDGPVTIIIDSDKSFY